VLHPERQAHPLAHELGIRLSGQVRERLAEETEREARVPKAAVAYSGARQICAEAIGCELHVRIGFAQPEHERQLTPSHPFGRVGEARAVSRA